MNTKINKISIFDHKKSYEYLILILFSSSQIDSRGDCASHEIKRIVLLGILRLSPTCQRSLLVSFCTSRFDLKTHN